MAIHLSHKMNHMNESVTVKMLPPSKGKVSLSVKALMSVGVTCTKRLVIIWV